MENEEVKKEETTANTAEGTQPQGEKPIVLLGAISYTDEANYEQFLHSMDINKALFILSSAANFAQSKGAYSVAESELISCASRAIRKGAAAGAEATSDNVGTEVTADAGPDSDNTTEDTSN